MQTSQTASDAPAPPPSGAAGGKSTRDSLVAELDALRRSDQSPAEPAPEDKAEAEEPAEEPPDDESEPAEEAEEEQGKSKGKDADKGDEQLDPATAKLMAASQREEKRRREAIASERAALKAAHEKALGELEAQRREIEEHRKSLDEFRGLRERAKYAPDAVLEALGLSAEDFEPAARALYARSPAAANDPKAKATAQAMMRERETAGSISELRKEIEAERKAWREETAALKKEISDRERTAEAQKAVDEYLGNVQKSVSPDDAPLVARWAEKSPAKVRQAFHAVALDLLEANDGAVPEPAEVVAEVERRRRADLEDSGFDVASILSPTKAKASSGSPPKTLARAGASPAAPAKRLTAEEQRAEFVRRRDAGTLAED